MSRKTPANPGASIRQRLLNHSRESGEAFQDVLVRYGIERLLFRLSRSPHVDRFLLKGARLFTVWDGAPHRPTRDLDLQGIGDLSVDELIGVFRDLAVLKIVPDDGLRFDPASVQAEQIRAEDRYGGIRVTLVATLDDARVPLQADVAFGDVVTPGPEEIIYPTVLEMEAPRLRGIPMATVVAEKFEAMVSLGIGNSRMKDFYDVWFILTRHRPKAPKLRAAIRATFARRETVVPAELPVALSPEFAEDPSKQAQWGAFLRRMGMAKDEAPTLAEVVEVVRKGLMPLVRARSEQGGRA